ncbi:MAG TPA: hypothetical protein VK658_13070 [Chryseolinea sp.]|nr:hypothetical protein [Chryseolinea sp.]
MVLHNASRLGVISYLYQQRHEIAYAMGIIAEIPIAMCSHDFDFNQGLTIHENQDSDATVPPILAQAQEIHLFINAPWDLVIDPRRPILSHELRTHFREDSYATPSLSIFHPPS